MYVEFAAEMFFFTKLKYSLDDYLRFQWSSGSQMENVCFKKENKL